MPSLKRILLVVCVSFAVLQLAILLWTALRCTFYHVLCSEVDYRERYGALGAWCVVTGGTSGQGRQLVLNFAQRGFNILLIGSKRSFDVQREITDRYGDRREVRVVLKDFTFAFEDDFFLSIEHAVSLLPRGKVAFLVNCVGHRVAYKPFHRMPTNLLRDTIAVGTLTHARMTRMLIPYLRERDDPNVRSGVLSITAQCVQPTILFGLASRPELSVPYLAAYEASNAFGHFFASSIYHEYKHDPTDCVDHLIIAPGAVITQNTADFLGNAPGAISEKEFVKNIMRLIGNVQGVWSGSWKQGLSLFLANLCPPFKHYVLRRTGETIARGLMQRDQRKKRDVSPPSTFREEENHTGFKRWTTQRSKRTRAATS